MANQIGGKLRGILCVTCLLVAKPNIRLLCDSYIDNVNQKLVLNSIWFYILIFFLRIHKFSIPMTVQDTACKYEDSVHTKDEAVAEYLNLQCLRTAWRAQW